MAENEFKKVFKYYKARDPPPSLEQVIDPARLDHRSHFLEKKVKEGDEDDIEANKYIQPCRLWTILESKLNPGFFVILNAFSSVQCSYWCQQCIYNYSSTRYKRNIDLHTDITDWVEASKKEKRVTDKLRWSTLGYHHNWDTKEYSESVKGEFPIDLAKISNLIAIALGYPKYKAEAAIVNYYPESGTLSGHTDHSEHNLSAPLISISFGLDAVFLLGGDSLAVKPVPYMLSSGTVVVMDKESRLCYHAVPRIIKRRKEKLHPGRLEDEEEEEFTRNYLATHRINLNIRQVN